jgi:hypothetical protein
MSDVVVASIRTAAVIVVMWWQTIAMAGRLNEPKNNTISISA